MSARARPPPAVCGTTLPRSVVFKHYADRGLREFNIFSRIRINDFATTHTHHAPGPGPASRCDALNTGWVVHIGPGGIFANFANLARRWGGWGTLIFTFFHNIAEMNVSEPSRNEFQFLPKNIL